MEAFKGFKKDMTCRGFQFKEGETYVHDGEVSVCNSGFHSCEYPLDVFSYYSPNESVFFHVTAGGDISTHDDDSKIASGSITIGAKIELPEIVSAAIKWITDRTKPELSESATGTRGASSATGTRGASSATGRSSIAMASGENGRALACAGAAIVLCAYDEDGNMTHVRSAIAGRGEVEPDTWYTLSDDGEFVVAVK